MSTESNRAAITAAVSKFAPATLAGYLELYHPDAKLHFLPPGLPPGPTGLRLFYEAVFAAFPDSRLAVHDTVAEGDRVAMRYTFTGTHRGDFMGVPASGKSVTLTGITILRMAGGKCVERWSEADFLGLYRQIGAVTV